MNWFVVTNGILYICASFVSAYQGRLAWAGVWVMYGLSALILAWLED